MNFGAYTYADPVIFWENPNAKLITGKFCSIAGGTKIFLGGNHRTDWVTTYPFGHIHQNIFTNFNGNGHPETKGDIVIGNDVWIAHGVTIMSGVKIGDGAVIANNSHVVKDVPPYSIIGGNPAKVVKFRFTETQICDLLKIKWWDWDENKINLFLPLLCSNDIQKFINEAKT